MSTFSSAVCIATRCSAVVLAIALATTTSALAGTIAPKNIARLRSLDGRTLAVFAPYVSAADNSFGALTQVGMHAQIDGITIRSLGYAWAARGDDRFLDRAASRLRSAIGILTDERNVAPLDPAQLDGLIDGYGIVRSSLSASDRTTIDRALAQIGRSIAATGGGVRDPHRIDLIGRIGLLIDDSTLSGEALSGFVDFIDSQLAKDGRTKYSIDRDALDVQVDEIEPLVNFALAADRNGRRIFDSANERGASLATAVAYLEPYATGRLDHREYVFSTRPDDARLRNVTRWERTKAERLFALASHFDARYDDLRIGFAPIGESATAILARLDR